MTVKYNVFGYITGTRSDGRDSEFFYICHGRVIDTDNLTHNEQRTIVRAIACMTARNQLPDVFQVAMRTMDEKQLLAEFPDAIHNVNNDAIISFTDINASIDEFFN